ncbi:hypothetical protein LPJ61_003564 [Coemansia biformis]|uniref:Uncharacterized protein n=1 Tax=Coemansia biformis TaxID=1286918 RepID=A0A9W8CXK4_9FUNG|nr:hypothetical protein LPJ61_003564 [Coemansia biformis]
MGSGKGGSRKKRTCDEHSNSSLLDIPDAQEGLPALPSFLLDRACQPDAGAGASTASDSSSSRKTFRVEPPSELLAQLRAFLPQIAEANKKLEAEVAKDPALVDIENIGSDETQYIEMDLGLGVFDVKQKASGKGPDDIIISASGKTGSCSASDAESSDAESSDSSAPRRSSRRVVIDPSSIAGQQKARPQIEVLETGSPMRTNMDSDSDSD